MQANMQTNIETSIPVEFQGLEQIILLNTQEFQNFEQALSALDQKIQEIAHQLLTITLAEADKVKSTLQTKKIAISSSENLTKEQAEQFKKACDVLIFKRFFSAWAYSND